MYKSYFRLIREAFQFVTEYGEKSAKGRGGVIFDCGRCCRTLTTPSLANLRALQNALSVSKGVGGGLPLRYA